MLGLLVSLVSWLLILIVLFIFLASGLLVPYWLERDRKKFDKWPGADRDQKMRELEEMVKNNSATFWFVAILAIIILGVMKYFGL